MKAKMLCNVLKPAKNGSQYEVTLYDSHVVTVVFKNEHAVVFDQINKVYYHDYPSAYQAEMMYLILCRLLVADVSDILPYGFRERELTPEVVNAMGYGFDIPAGAKITGIVLETRKK